MDVPEHVRPDLRSKGMADVIFVALTIAIFVILGLVVKAVERL
ncbi:hypothetical protein Ssi03_59240 [Sphaerisporangium siamense]|uniref:Potassium-transporting ATPase n=1 Tax=Sphaerisporangium siamense TaxID=795645 RepID=A0A7W7D4D1_9ACTN|nr:hypothetical protein [Sphaerisporangium siamense]MBB4699754.1 hypothetical protein [Sphaerisporangium siamense]GII87934.1 hypothetical protein Ssi03_59240 [Sphaerisporangium siamense]